MLHFGPKLHKTFALNWELAKILDIDPICKIYEFGNAGGWKIISLNIFGAYMKKLLIMTTGILLTIGAAHAKKDCTTEPKEKWMKEADFRKMVEDGGQRRTS